VAGARGGGLVIAARRPAAPGRDAVTALVRGMIADGTLKPGAPVPSGAELAREAGCHTVTSRAALRALLADGTLARGPSRGARMRVALPGGAPAADVGAPGQRLSRELAARRRAAGLRQPDLARLLGVSVTSVGHAETGRVWQSRGFWERADGVLLAGGALLRLHEQYQAAVSAPAPQGAGDGAQEAGSGCSCGRCAVSVTVEFCDGRTVVTRPPGPGACLPAAGRQG